MLALGLLIVAAGSVTTAATLSALFYYPSEIHAAVRNCKQKLNADFQAENSGIPQTRQFYSWKPNISLTFQL